MDKVPMDDVTSVIFATIYSGAIAKIDAYPGRVWRVKGNG